jgi:hypothetical protein
MSDNIRLNVFNPTQIEAISEAYRQTCDALRFALDPAERHEQEGTRIQLARMVIEVAESGERDPKRIAAAALAKMPPLRANWR